MKRIALALIVLVFGACEIEPVVAPPIDRGDVTPVAIGDDNELFEHKNCIPGPWGCGLCFAEKVVSPGYPNTDEPLVTPPLMPLPSDYSGCPWGDNWDDRWGWF